MIKTTFLGSVYKPELNIIGDIIHSTFPNSSKVIKFNGHPCTW